MRMPTLTLCISIDRYVSNARREKMNKKTAQIQLPNLQPIAIMQAIRFQFNTLLTNSNQVYLD